MNAQPLHRTTLYPGLTLWLALSFAFLCYLPGIDGGLHFDDSVNLAALSKIEDLDSALEFIFSGKAGLLGRPISLATFSAQYYAWPDVPGVFLQANILIHLLNACLVAWLAFLVNLNRPRDERTCAWIAVTAASIWVLMPLLASSSLFIVQRMTTLSATFLLAALIAYLTARRGIKSRPYHALALMTVAIGLGTILSALAKENGILLPLFALALESTVFERPYSLDKRTWRAWLAVTMLVPLVAVALYLSTQIPYSETVITSRHFDGTSRLLSEAQILWLYLANAFIPQPSVLGPFHDNFSVHHDLFEFYSLLAVFLWITTIVAACFLRRRYPEFALAVAWYLFGHLLESTSVPLELYFEHRNYVPIIGPVFSAVSIVFTRDWKIKSWHVGGVAAAYAIVLGFSLFNQASVWGNPRIAADMWAIYNPNSARALLYLTSALEKEGDYGSSLAAIDRYILQNPDGQHGHLLKVVYSCAGVIDVTDAIKNHDYRPVSSPIGFGNWASQAFEKIYSLHVEGNCRSMTAPDVIKLGLKLLEVPEIQASPHARHNINAILAADSINHGNFTAANGYLDTALAAQMNLDTLEVAIRVAVDTEDSTRAHSLLTRAQHTPPFNPYMNMRWKDEMRRLEKLVVTREKRGTSTSFKAS